MLALSLCKLHTRKDEPCLPKDPVQIMLHQFSESLGYAIDAKDPYTWCHSEEVARISQDLALAMDFSESRADIVHIAGHLHDIGKIGVPDSILRKRGPLSDADWRMVQKHPAMGADIVRPVKALEEMGVVEMILHHHERFDGKGYPHGLRGEEIPIESRIIAVADSLSAILHNRPYRNALPFEKAAREIIRCSGSQFDPNIVKVFKKNLPEIRRTVETLDIYSDAGP